MRRTLVASLAPAVAVTFAWLTTEEPPRWAEAAAVAALAIAAALPRRWWLRAVAVAILGAAAIAAVTDVRLSTATRTDDVVEPITRALSNGIGDFYGVVLPFDPSTHGDMHALVLLAVLGFVAAASQLVAVRRPLGAAAVTIVGVGWPATLTESDAVVLGAVCLAAVLSLLVALRVGSVRAALPSVAVASVVVVAAAWASSAAAIAESPALNWRTWDFRGAPATAFGVRYVWNADYDGIGFPPTRTTVLEIEGPERAQYWRVSTLDLFTADRWFEELYPQRIRPAEGTIALDSLAPRQARDRSRWLEQKVKVKALVDDRIAAAGTPVAIAGDQLGPVYHLSGGVVRARRTIPAGTEYRVWSYVPDPTPAKLAAAPASYPSAAGPFLVMWGRSLPAFGAAGRDARMGEMLSDPAFGLAAYEPVYELAREVTRDASTPYAAVLALEAWFRRVGGFSYEERPRRATSRPPLVDFVTRTREGYCQHFAGAMAAMLRLVGVPARVAVGFTSGRRDGDTWKVSDHEAHAWVEVWFPGEGWVPFDPTPGRGTFSGVYSYASENAQAVAALGRGDLDAVSDTESGRGVTGRRLTGSPATTGDERPALVLLVLVVGLAVAVAIGLGKWVVRRVRFLSRDPRAVASASRRELEGFLRDQRVAISPGATLEDLRRAVESEMGVDGTSFVQAAGRARFGPPGDVKSSAQVRRELRSLLRGMRGSLSPWRRVRGFVSLRSVAGGEGA